MSEIACVASSTPRSCFTNSWMIGENDNKTDQKSITRTARSKIEVSTMEGEAEELALVTPLLLPPWPPTRDSNAVRPRSKRKLSRRIAFSLRRRASTGEIWAPGRPSRSVKKGLDPSAEEEKSAGYLAKTIYKIYKKV